MAKTTKLAASGKAQPPGKQVPLATLTSLLGKTVDDPAVTAVVDRAGKVKISSDFLVAKEAGFDFSLDRAPGKKKKVLSTLFLFAEGADGHRGYTDLPKGFAFSARRDLLAKHPTPSRTWKIGPGKVPADTPDDQVSHDTWTVGDLEVVAHYRQGVARYFTITVSEELAGADLSTHPLHFETKPADAPKDAELVGMALLVAWATDRHGLSPKHANTELGNQLANRAITPREFLIRACGKTLTTLDVAPKLGEFLAIYTHNQHDDDEGARDAVAKKIAKLLKLGRDDERRYTDDFLGTFASVVDNPYHVPDSWEAVDRIAPVIDARLADYEATQFRKPPALALYEKAAKLRDKQKVTAARAAIERPPADDSLAGDLIALVGSPLADKHVKAVLARGGLPVGKRIDEQANPALGVSYMGAKFEIDGKPQLGVDDVCFYAAKYRTYIRGIGSEVEFMAYPGLLPGGVRIGDTRDAVRAKVGAPKKSDDDYDRYASKTRTTMYEYKKDKLVKLRVARVRES